jgi:sigma-B regulation protein RsbU (phosphoserine phosphatase)
LLYDKVKKESFYLKEGCIGLGMMDTIQTIEEGDVLIENNSKLLCYTDGLIEVAEKRGVSSNEQTVEMCFCNDRNIKETFSKMLEKMQIDKSNPTIFDDITMLGLDFNINE